MLSSLLYAGDWLPSRPVLPHSLWAITMQWEGDPSSPAEPPAELGRWPAGLGLRAQAL